MKLKKKSLIIFLFIVAFVLFSKMPVYAGYQEWKALDYDVTVNEDGSMDVIETWDVYVSETNTLFKDFDLSKGNYEISNVKISRVDEGDENNLQQIFVEQYHVDPNSYYGLMIDSDTFEIAWNVGLDNSSDDRIYKMYYTVENAVTIYKDCTELYWQFLSDKNTMTGDNVTGRIKLPNSVGNIERLRVWGHGDYSAEIQKVSEREVIFTLPKVRSNKMLEVRVVTEDNIYPSCINKINRNYIGEILEEEQTWADEANREREEAKKIMTIMKFVIGAFIVGNLLILFIALQKRKEYRAVGEQLKEEYSYEKIELEYFRDIPDEANATPARAAYMYSFKNNSSIISDKISKIFAATMLDLSLKGLIAFEQVDEKEVRICRPSSIKENINLSEDEQIIYDLLKEAMLGKDSITPKEFSKYASREYETVYAKLNRLDKIVQDYEIEAGKISKERTKISKAWSSKFGVYLILAILSFFLLTFLPAIPISMGILANACRKNALYVSILTYNGIEEVARWKGLKKYMNDYSMLSDKLVPDIVLWEKYLVYATTFGISKKVIEQLKTVHPEMFETTYNNNTIHNYAYWNMITTSNFGGNSFDDFSKSLERVYSSAQSAYSAAHSSSSSGSGGGGGFSGGGGGRRWRWKLRRTLKVITNNIYKKEIII